MFKPYSALKEGSEDEIDLFDDDITSAEIIEPKGVSPQPKKAVMPIKRPKSVPHPHPKKQNASFNKPIATVSTKELKHIDISSDEKQGGIESDKTPDFFADEQDSKQDIQFENLTILSSSKVEDEHISGLGKVLLKPIRSVKSKEKRKSKKRTEGQSKKEVNIPIIYIAMILAFLLGAFSLCNGWLINHYDKSIRATEFNLEFGETYRIEKISLGDIIKVKFQEQGVESSGTPITFKYRHKSVDDAYYRLFKYYLKEGDYVVYTDTHELSRVDYDVESVYEE